MKNFLTILGIITASLTFGQSKKMQLGNLKFETSEQEIKIHKCIIENEYKIEGRKFTKNSFLNTAESLEAFKKEKNLGKEWDNKQIRLKFNKGIFLDSSNGHEEKINGKMIFKSFKERFPKCYKN